MPFISGSTGIQSRSRSPISLRMSTPLLARSAKRSKRLRTHWPSRHDCIVHKLSGGLDSSIVACCLKDAPRRPTITCVNDYATGPDSDERIFARLAANRAGSELLERPRAADLRLDACLSSVRTAAPSPQFLELAHDRPAVNLACERKATAVSTGVQGDATFHMHPAELAAADFAGRHGLNSSFFRVSLDAARLA